MAKNLDWGWGIRGGKKMYHSLCFPKLNQCRNSNWNLPIFFPYKFHIKNIEMLLSLVKKKIRPSYYLMGKQVRENMSYSSFWADSFLHLWITIMVWKSWGAVLFAVIWETSPKLPGTKLLFWGVTSTNSAVCCSAAPSAKSDGHGVFLGFICAVAVSRIWPDDTVWRWCS